MSPMPIPTFDKLLRPVLVLASQKPISRRLAHEALTTAAFPRKKPLRLWRAGVW